MWLCLCLPPHPTPLSLTQSLTHSLSLFLTLSHSLSLSLSPTHTHTFTPCLYISLTPGPPIPPPTTHTHTHAHTHIYKPCLNCGSMLANAYFPWTNSLGHLALVYQGRESWTKRRRSILSNRSIPTVAYSVAGSPNLIKDKPLACIESL